METDKPIKLSEISEKDKKLIERQLKVVLASTYFNSAKQMKRFLEYIVRKTLNGEGKFLKQYTIGIEALGFPKDFDSDSNPSVRIMGGRVRRRLNEFNENNNHNKIIISMPKGTYSPTFFIRTVTKDKPVEDNAKFDEMAYTSTGPKLALISYTDKTQNDRSNRLLLQATDVIAEELSRFVSTNLSVHNPFADKSESHGLQKDVTADYALALYVQELEVERYELICRLGKTGAQEIIWSKSCNLKNTISISKQIDTIKKIVGGVADIHQGRMHPHWSRNLLLNKESIPYKYKALAYYVQYYDDLSKNAFSEAVNFYNQALIKNPNDVLANILFSDLCRRDHVHLYNIIDSVLNRGIECAQRAVHLKPDSFEAHYVLGQLLFSLEDFDDSYNEFEVARKLSNLNSSIECGCGFHFCLMGKWEEGLFLVKKSIELSNRYPSWFHLPLFLNLYYLGKFDEALIEAKKIVSPNIIHGPLTRCLSYFRLNNISLAKKEYEALLQRAPNIKKSNWATITRLFGKSDLVEKMLEDLKRISSI